MSPTVLELKSPKPARPSSSYWRTYRLFGLTLTSDFDFANKLVPGAGTPDVTFTCSTGAPPLADWEKTAPSYTSRRRTPEGASALTIRRLDGCDILSWSRIADFYLWPDRIMCHLLDSRYSWIVEIRLLGSVLAFWLERLGIPALHAASVVLGDKAVAFLSSNSGGKSSIAATFLKVGYPLLSDDIVAIRNHEDQAIVLPAYPQMRMWPDEAQHFLGEYQTLEIVHPAHTKRRVPVGSGGLGAFCDKPQRLAALYLPQRCSPTEGRTTIDITPVPVVEALFAMLRHSFVGDVIEAFGNQPQRLNLLASLASKVPVRRLVYPSGFQYLPLLREAIIEDLERVSVF
jgi:hypothetical protein